MTYLCRCSNHKCHLRRALAKRPEEYIRPPKCPGCGGRKYKRDEWQERSNASKLCRCDGYWFIANGAPHRRGSRWCEANASKLTLEELAEHYGGEPMDYVGHPRAVFDEQAAELVEKMKSEAASLKQFEDELPW